MTQAAPSPNQITPDAEVIRPFRVEVREEDLDDLRGRLRATRWPEKETVGDLTWMKWMSRPSISVWNWGTAFSLASNRWRS